MKEIPKTYNPHEIEPEIYSRWIRNDCFRAEPDPSRKSFTVVIPPPNVTGQLHMGHAFNVSIQDALVRSKRMQGFNALWIPGTDHAGIATQIKVEEMLRERGETRFDHGREGFIRVVWDWKHRYGSRIIEQLKTLGASCDWSHERFTMDEGLSKAVREVFVRLYEKGLIYQGHRIVNWCPSCATALSDTEVEHTEQDGHLWYVRYPLEGGGFITVATTRPETMMGDTAVVVHPDDKRYVGIVGRTVILPLMNRPIPVMADDSVDMTFGTGAVKVTPAHDPNDFDLGKKYGLAEITVLGLNAAVNENGGVYQGLDRYKARERIVEDLSALGLLEKVEGHAHNVGHCHRCDTVVEPMLSLQWFVKMGPLAGPAARAVRDGTIRFVPDRFSKIYLNWMDNVRDWCISRQLWWGHRIPAFTCEDCGHMTVSREDLTSCPLCGSHRLAQDPDVLDTWFSSALWPFSTLGWPEETPELRCFYPTDVLVTAYDIIFFWVARMIFSGLEHTGRAPFHSVLIHGLLRDSQGRKMAKSLGNGVDPVEIVAEYGADALRFALLTGVAPGNDVRFSVDRVAATRNFCNKLWNAARFVRMNLEVGRVYAPPGGQDSLSAEDGWLLTRYRRLVSEVTAHFDKYELGLAAQKLYDFLWDDYCDWYIELCKPRLSGSDAEKELSRRVLSHVLVGTLKLLHPITPFITETLWQGLAPFVGESGLLVVSSWPTIEDVPVCLEDEADMERLIAVIRAVRTRRGELNVPSSKRCGVTLVTALPDLFERGRAFLVKLAGADPLVISDVPPADTEGLVQVVTADARVFLPLAELVDPAAERVRLTREITAIEAELAKLTVKLGNPGFLGKAPAVVVAAERGKAAALEAKLPALRDGLKALFS